MSAVSISIFKAYGARTNRQFVNTYEAVLRADQSVTDAADPTDFITLAQALVTAEQQLLSTNIYFHRYTIRTWMPDSTPYDPDSLTTEPLAVQGLRAPAFAAATQEDLRMVYIVTKKTERGKPGFAFLRGVLFEADVENVGGYWTLTAGTDVVQAGAAFVAYKAALSTFISTGAASTALAMIGGTLTKTVVDAGTTPATTRIKRTYGAPYNVRLIQEFRTGGVSMRQQGNRYFDRPA
jgi:hypothetical protein